MTTGDTHGAMTARATLRRRLRWAVAGVAAGIAVTGASAAWLVTQEIDRLGALSLASAQETSVTVLDRNGHLLRAYTTNGGRWRLPVTHEQVDQRYLKLLLAFEDRRFFEHGGVDTLALARAGWQFLRFGRIISGGSTLTMQVARLLTGKHERTARGKLRQIVRAVQLEYRLSKHEILDLYLRLAPFGGNIEGVRAAALTYFGKEPRRLSLGEAALLVALPQAPESRRPDRFGAAAKRARARVLARGAAAGLISDAEVRRASAEAMPRSRRAFAKLAGHLSDAEVAAAAWRKVHRLTIERNLQAKMERLVARHVAAIGRQVSAALMVVAHDTGEVLARVGSAGLFDSARFGAIDMTRAMRSPGSALKPVVYGLAFEFGLAHPETLIDDRPVRFGTYAPKNFDEGYRGTLSLREALALSLNVPAVKVLDKVGPGRFVGRLRRAGVTVELPEAGEPSLAVALGGLGIRLEDMARLYAALARGGEPIALRQRLLQQPRLANDGHTTKPLLGKVATYYVTDILKGAPPPTHARNGQIAYKTGTSYGYRDAWAAGFDGQHTIVAWVGRPDAASTPGLTGRTAAAPLLFDAFQRVSATRAPLARAPKDALLVGGAKLPEPLRRFERRRRTVTAGAFLVKPPRIAFPPDRSEVGIGEDADAIVLKASGGALPLTWLADGKPIAVRRRGRHFVWQSAPSGFVRLTVIDAEGRTDRVRVRLLRGSE